MDQRLGEGSGPRNLVTLSTSSMFPESTASGFEVASRLGFDGVEVMIGIDPIAADVEAVIKLRDYYGVPVTSIHAPTLVVTQHVWRGTGHWDKLRRSAEMALAVDCDVIVVHPPFRWQGDYATGFVHGIASVSAETGVRFCVENMYPWRTPAGEYQAYLPTWDPTNQPYEHLALDLSHAATAQVRSLAYVAAWGERLQHIHLTDGLGSYKDEHLSPGTGGQDADGVLALALGNGYTGDLCLEVNTRGAGSRAARERVLASARDWTRERVERAVGVAPRP
ncbi:Sugar phosphate isomerase/epimerase [Raineyella antarctica]|uniref:Sugar phosphate isomerase/epimerase n=1 Tax=Raineyella antarctica TaxID=1577474 RepID=A0A1G6GEQ1_9ACTN|nr:sugar phosphate isomerase/epimerase [Raineyella antarctica]SDB80225.1 Sugar phosphate isomerase/epimerase [Raineyella antarctica]